MKPGFVVPLWEKFAYGIGDFGINVVFTAVSFYLLYFVINVTGIPAKLAGSIFLAVNLYSAVLNFIVGMVSDRTETRFGRRRPFILFGCLPVSVLFVLLWLVPFDGLMPSVAYFSLIYLLYITLFTLVSMPYNSLMPELSQNYDERTSISGIRMGLTFVGNLIGAAGVALIVDEIYKGREFYRHSYPVMAVIAAAVFMVSLLTTFVWTKERVKSEAEVTGGIFEIISSIMKLRESRIAIAMFITNLLGFNLIQCLFLFYLKDVLKMPESMTYVLLGLPLITAVVAAPLWVFIGERKGKKTAYFMAMTYMVLVMLSALFLPPSSILMAGLLCGLAGIGISATQVIPFSMMPDVIEFDELLSGARREGAFYGVAFSLLTVLTGVVIWCASMIMGIFGYVENSTLPQPGPALASIRIMIGIGPGLFFIISAIFVRLLPITRESHEEVRRLLEERKQG
jgi:glycoside/pentoside/hexuronide:cation symporter, GPH family